MNNQAIFRYPRTQHIEGSRLQEGDEDLECIPFSKIRGRNLVIEEKVDGANAGISFGNDLNLQLQSRGHFLTGGHRERHFNLFKQWASWIAPNLLDILENRYIMYGEWMFAKHTVFYDALPHYFMEFDILDTEEGEYQDEEGKTHKGSWLSTDRRMEMLKGLPIEHVLVLYQGKLDSLDELKKFLTKSHFKTEECWDVFLKHFVKYNMDEEEVIKGTDSTPYMEGLYIKWEEDGVVKGRYKFVRPDFLQVIKSSDTHWLDRPIVPNLLIEGKNIYS